jgi:DNA mismatch repair protein MutL
MHIRVLPPELASKIAAGEVVERPASVVKELVENALDADASRITVEIEACGVGQVRVSDDGRGIAAPEVELAFQRHATSKLQTTDQLESIATLGFRGEALPSIAAVSRLSLTTRTCEAEAGYQVQVEWGQLTRSSPQGCPPGTSVKVSDLFGNLPARRRFLKSNAAETSRVHDIVARYALAYADVRFQLIVDGRTVITTPGSGKARETLLELYGADVAASMLEVSGEDPETGYRVDGFISPPGVNRANRTYMTFFINRRWVQSRMLSYALEEAYHGLLQDKRYPVSAINVGLPYQDVDVNSHPAKREVRLHHEGRVFSTLQKAVRAALIADSPVPQMRTPAGPSTGGLPPRAGVGPSFFSRGAFGGPRQDYYAPPDAAAPRQYPSALKVVGQLKLTYVVAEGPEGMFLVDQHAAHERVLFDRIRRDAGQRSSLSQPLLEPVTVELTPSQIEVLGKHADFLESYGFQVEVFGDNAYLLRSVPVILTTQDPGKSLLDVLDLVAFEGLMRQREDIMAASIACHSAIRAGKPLTESEMRALLEQLEGADNPHTCPHGRPTMIHFSSYHMEREFGRR